MTKNVESEVSTSPGDFPTERVININGEAITVQKFTFAQGLKAEPLIQPMIHDMRRLLAGDAEEAIEYRALADIFGRHADEFLELIAIACGRPRAWIETLTDRDGQLLAMTFWTVNSRFFTGQIIMSDIKGLNQTSETDAKRESGDHPDVFIA